MPVHDWSRVDAGIFHDFHVTWVPGIKTVLNNGILPDGYYALAEQHAGRTIPDVLTLHASPGEVEPLPLPPDSGGTALAEAPPKVRLKETVEPTAVARRRTLAIRHVSGHRLVALLEVLSPANKDRARHVAEFAEKAVTALQYGIHLLIVDLFRPGPYDPSGFPGAIRERLDDSDASYDIPAAEPFTLASYAAGPRIEIFREHVGVGCALPEMPLFVRPDRYVPVPLESTYQAAYRGMPKFWREVLETNLET